MDGVDLEELRIVNSSFAFNGLPSEYLTALRVKIEHRFSAMADLHQEAFHLSSAKQTTTSVLHIKRSHGKCFVQNVVVSFLSLASLYI